ILVVVLKRNVEDFVVTKERIEFTARIYGLSEECECQPLIIRDLFVPWKIHEKIRVDKDSPRHPRAVHRWVRLSWTAHCPQFTYGMFVVPYDLREPPA